MTEVKTIIKSHANELNQNGKGSATGSIFKFLYHILKSAKSGIQECP